MQQELVFVLVLVIVIVQVQVNYVRSTNSQISTSHLSTSDQKLSLIVGAYLCARGISYLIPLAKFALAQGLRSAELTALLARVFTETLVSRFYSLLTSDRALEMIVIVIVIVLVLVQYGDKNAYLVCQQSKRRLTMLSEIL